MTDMSDADVREMARTLAGAVTIDPAAIDPEFAASIGFELAMSLNMADDDFLTGVEYVKRLLHFGLTFLPNHPMHADWQFCLSSAYGHLAEIYGRLTDWEAAVHWGRAALSSGFDDLEDIAEVTRELVRMQIGRLGVLSQGDLLPATLLAEIRSLLAELDALDAPDLVTRTYIATRTAHVLSLCWDLTSDLADLRRMIDILTEFLPFVPDDDPAGADVAEMFARACLLSTGVDGMNVPLAPAVAAAANAVDLAPTADRHWLLARLLCIDETPDSRNRIIDSLSFAAQEIDDPEIWEQLAGLLVDRGGEQDDVGDLRSAIHWLDQCLGRVRDPWFTWATLTEAHDHLLRLTGDPVHADLVVDHATKAIDESIPDTKVEQEMHVRRLQAVFLDNKRSDLESFVRRHPVFAWIEAAQRTVGTHLEDRSVESGEAVAPMTVAQSWLWLLQAAPHLFIDGAQGMRQLTDDTVRMLGVVGEIEDLADEVRAFVDLFTEMMTCLGKILAGDKDLDFPVARALMGDPRFADHRDNILGMVGMLSSMVGSDTGALAPLDSGLPRLVSGAQDPVEYRESQAFRAAFELSRLLNTGSDADRMLAKMHEIKDLLTQGPVSPAGALLRTFFESAVRAVDGETDAASQSAEALIQPLAAMKMLENIQAGVRRSDVRAVREACVELDRHVGGEKDTDIVSLRFVRAFAYQQLARLQPHDRHALEVAISGYEERLGKELVERNPRLEQTAMPLAGLLRMRDEPADRARSRALGLETLRGAAWRVLIQSSTDHALEIARGATSMADELVSWCLADNAFDDLVTTLDARRSLVLESARTGRTVADRLTALGHDDLARQWTDAEGRDDTPLLPGWETMGGDWGALRRRVMGVLADQSGLPAMPTVTEIQEALRVQGSDALVYLVAATEHATGMAVVVPVAGDVSVRELARLRVGPGTAIASYAMAYDDWYNGGSEGPWRKELRSVCEWGWRAAGEELLAVGGERLVVVPVGELGLLPWHATVREKDGVDRYLIQDLVLSYAPSARLFCDVTSRPAVTDGAVVLVGNPARDLPAGIAEATALREVYHPEGVVLGSLTVMPRPRKAADGGPGTPDQVRAALCAPLSLLHLACHAVADMRNPLLSSVMLAGDSLSAQELLEVDRTNALPVDTVTLAGCTTNVSGADYDEALSLSTTFLALGARTVVGSLWRVPAGQTTTQLMFLLRHYIHNGLNSAEALAHAQRWMLDPQRTYPPETPGYIRDMPASSGFDHADIECWAGFTHQGR